MGTIPRTGKRQVSHSALCRAREAAISVTPEYTCMAAGVLRMVFVYDLVSGVLLTISLLLLCSIVAMCDQAFERLPRLCWLLLGSSPIGVYSFVTRCLLRYDLRDHFRLHRSPIDPSEKSSIVSGIGDWRLPHDSSDASQFSGRDYVSTGLWKS